MSLGAGLLQEQCGIDPRAASLAEWLRRPTRERKIPGSNLACAEIITGSSHTSDLKIGTPVAILPGAWRDRVSAGTGRPGVSILSLGETESLLCKFYLSVAARKIVRADPFLGYTRMLLGTLSNQQTNESTPGSAALVAGALQLGPRGGPGEGKTGRRGLFVLLVACLSSQQHASVSSQQHAT